MIRLATQPMDTVEDLRVAVQHAIEIELSTLPPYLYALYSIEEGTNAPARERIRSIVLAEMVHVALACNVLNAIGGSPKLADAAIVPRYPGPLPYSIGSDGGPPFSVSLLPFSPAAVQQAMHIEEPEDPIVFAEAFAATFDTIGSFYASLDEALGALPASAWQPGHNQFGDHPFFAGRVTPVKDHPSAKQAIDVIVREGEGTSTTPLDFFGEVAHYYRFQELDRRQELQKDTSKPEGFSWGADLDVDWSAVAPAISDPATHDFSADPAGQAAQDRCDRAYTAMLAHLDAAANGNQLRLGEAVRAMFELRAGARDAFTTPLADGTHVAGPSFRFRPDLVPDLLP